MESFLEPRLCHCFSCRSSGSALFLLSKSISVSAGANKKWFKYRQMSREIGTEATLDAVPYFRSDLSGIRIFRGKKSSSLIDLPIVTSAAHLQEMLKHPICIYFSHLLYTYHIITIKMNKQNVKCTRSETSAVSGPSSYVHISVNTVAFNARNICHFGWNIAFEKYLAFEKALRGNKGNPSTYIYSLCFRWYKLK